MSEIDTGRISRHPQEGEWARTDDDIQEIILPGLLKLVIHHISDLAGSTPLGLSLGYLSAGHQEGIHPIAELQCADRYHFKSMDEMHGWALCWAVDILTQLTSATSFVLFRMMRGS